VLAPVIYLNSGHHIGVSFNAEKITN